jgi:hypothetical protein
VQGAVEELPFLGDLLPGENSAEYTARIRGLVVHEAQLDAIVMALGKVLRRVRRARARYRAARASG